MEIQSISVEYLGGHPLYMKKDKGELRISSNDISFWSGRFSKSQRFSVLLKDIEKVDLQEQSKITLTRALLLGFASLVFKKKKRYLVLYFNIAGMESGAIFDFPGDRGDNRKREMMQKIIEAKMRLS